MGRKNTDERTGRLEIQTDAPAPPLAGPGVGGDDVVAQLQLEAEAAKQP